MFDDWNVFDIAVGVLTVIGILILIATFVLVSFEMTGGKCDLIGEKMNVEHQYSILTGCLIKVDGNWVPLSSYRVMP